MLWLYDLPTLIPALLIIGSFVAFSLIGRLIVNKVYYNKGGSEIIPATVSTVSNFFGLTLALISIGTWGTYNTIESNLSQEVAYTSVVWRNAALYSTANKSTIRSSLIDYVGDVIGDEWPLQRKGVIPGKSAKLDHLQDALVSIEPTTEASKIMQASTVQAFNDMLRFRRARMQTITDALPSLLWNVMIVGALVTIACHWFLHEGEHQYRGRISTEFVGLIVGLLIFLTWALDHPYLGEVSISPEKYEILLKRMLL